MDIAEALSALGILWRFDPAPQTLPSFGIVRLQWHGPWMKTSPQERGRHTHWVATALVRRKTQHGHSRKTKEASQAEEQMFFEAGAIAQGGWIGQKKWDQYIRPWMLATTEPEADGHYSILHAFTLARPPRHPVW